MSLVTKTCKNKFCYKEFQIDSKFIKYKLKLGINDPYAFCQQSCAFKYKSYTQSKMLNCTNCDKVFKRDLSGLNKNNFCCQSCAATYNNKHKTKGYRRSKLEVFIEKQIKNSFPNLEFITNSTKLINYELDFYFPNINLAMEINGIFHYKPIYGEEKLNKIKTNDCAKKKLCKKNKIKLIVIKDKFIKYNIKDANQIWNKVYNILVPLVGFEPT